MLGNRCSWWSVPWTTKKGMKRGDWTIFHPCDGLAHSSHRTICLSGRNIMSWSARDILLQSPVEVDCFSSMQDCSRSSCHPVKNMWEIHDVIFCKLEVSRHTCPCSSHWDDLVNHYEIWLSSSWNYIPWVLWICLIHVIYLSKMRSINLNKPLVL